jgi:carbon monoxide dehydrogenase subunit G
VLSVESTVTVARPLEEVFDFVSDPANDVKWHHNVVAATRTSEGPLGVGSTFKWDVSFLGKRKADVRVTRYEPHDLAANHVKSGLMEVTVSYRFAPDDGGTRVTRRLDIPLPRVVRLVTPLVRPFARRDNDHHAEWLKDVLEREDAHGHGPGGSHHPHHHGRH